MELDDIERISFSRGKVAAANELLSFVERRRPFLIYEVQLDLIELARKWVEVEDAKA